VVSVGVIPCHEPVIDMMERGTVHHIEGSMNGPLGDYCTKGKMRGLGVLRSHGGRWQRSRTAKSTSDVAVIAAPSADAFGNANGSHGRSACGSIGFALADSIYADWVVVVTDNLVRSVHPLADPGEQRRLRRRGRLDRGSGEDRSRVPPRSPRARTA